VTASRREATALRRGRRCRAGFDEAKYVAFGHTTGDAASLKRGDIYPVLGGDFPDKRRRPGADAILERIAVPGVGRGDGGRGRLLPRRR